MRLRRFLAFFSVLTLVTLVAACGGDDSGSENASSDTSSGDNSDGSEPISDGGFDIDVGTVGADADLSNEEVIANIQDFWGERAGDVGVNFERIPDDRIASVPGDTEAPICGGVPIAAEDVAMNAFAAPCPEGLTVAWDPALIDDTITDLFGEAGPAVVFAHEFGHVMQFQSGILDITGQGIGDPPSVLTENQADCFSGAWVAQQVEDAWGPFADPGALDKAIGAMIFVRDTPGSDPGDALAHGSGFDRVRAFQDGVDQDIEYCFNYVNDPPFIDELPFTNGDDVANNGNLPFDEVTDLVIQDLDDFFSANVDSFEGPGDPFDVIPQDELEQLHAEIGDGSVATLFGMLWAEQAQAAAGDDLDGEGPLLQRSCLVGAWLGDILTDQQDGTVDRASGVSLSPGDLDEVIITFLKLTDEAMAQGGVAFEAIGDMRTGVFGGIDDCDLGE
jgi:hypothetical protein